MNIAGSCAALLLAFCAGVLPARADDAPAPPEDWSAHFQLTAIDQAHPSFHSPFQGPNSLAANTENRESISGTAYFGGRLPWQGGELYFNPEFNQGFGLSRTEGLEGFSNGEASKAGFDNPKPNVARLFVRQIFGLGGEQETLAPDANQLGETVDVARVTLTAGKYSASDIFDDNQYAHDPRTQFMNDSFWESVGWDYPADAKGYTDGLAVELNQKAWALRGGWFLEPKIANQRNLDPRFVKRYGTVAELETRQELWGEPGKWRFLLFANRAPQGNYDQAVSLGITTAMLPNIVLVRRDSWKVGGAINLEQSVTDALGLFARVSMNDGRTEGWSFNDISRAISAGASLKGSSWNRPKDVVGLAAGLNGASKPARNFLAAGGLGILAGDGRLSYAPEAVVESYYSYSVTEPLTVSLDYQFVADPAFDSARGPVSIFAARVHLEF